MSQSGYPPWAFFFGYLLYSPDWPLARYWFAFLNLLATWQIVRWVRERYRRLDCVPVSETGEPLSTQPQTETGLLLLTLSVLALSAFCSTLGNGQFGIICVAMVTLAEQRLRNPARWSQIASGVLLGAALSKPNLAALFLLPVMLNRHWWSIGSCFAYFIAGTAAVCWHAKSDPAKQFWLLSRAGAVSTSQGSNVLLKWLTSGRYEAYLVVGMLGLVVLAIVFRLMKTVGARSGSEMGLVDQFALAAVGSGIWTYQRFYDQVVFVFVLVSLAIRLRRVPDAFTLLVTALLCVLLWAPTRVFGLPFVGQSLFVIKIAAAVAICRAPVIPDNPCNRD